jgi:hypothetical protein
MVDTRGNLVALHQYSTRTKNQGVPASEIARHLESAGYAGLLRSAASAGVAHFGVYSADAREKVCQGMADDYEVIARALGIEAAINDAYALWDWLAAHRTLYKLRGTLTRLGRADLAHLLDYDLIKIDRPAIQSISDQAAELVASILPAAGSRTPAELLAETAFARYLAATLRSELGSLPGLQESQALALQWRMNWSQEFTRAETALVKLMRMLPADSGQARRMLSGVDEMIRHARATETAAIALKDLAQSPALSL